MLGEFGGCFARMAECRLGLLLDSTRIVVVRSGLSKSYILIILHQQAQKKL